MNKGRTLAFPPSAWIDRDALVQTPELARGPDEQVTAYFHEHAEPLYRYLCAVYRCDEDAEEVTQEAFLRLYEALASGERIENPRAWVYAVARRLMLNCRKRDRNEETKKTELARLVGDVDVTPLGTPEAVLADQQRTDALRHALRTLPLVEKQCLYARAQGLKLREIGEMSGLDLRRVAEVISRAVQRLQRQIGG